MQIGMALSGGGIRATVFHLGVLGRLASENRLEAVSFLSTVSGGSLCIGLVLAANNGVWPSSAEYRSTVTSKIRKLLTTYNLQHRLIARTILSPKYLLHRRAECLASLLEDIWGLAGQVCDLPEYPRWVINASCHETGKRWRFERKRMGDYVFGETTLPAFPVSEAVAASAGVPYAIGSLVLDTMKYEWERYEGKQKRPYKPELKQVHLWDGALYDNLGTEAFAKRNDGFDFLIISDASTPLKLSEWSFLNRYRRIYDIAASQSQGVRSRLWVDKFIENNSTGRYLRIGNSLDYIFKEADRHSEIDELRSKCLQHEVATQFKHFDLTLRSLTPEEFESLFRHGFEVADCTLYAYWDDQFPLMTYDVWQNWGT